MLDDLPGRRILIAAWAADVVFALSAAPAAVGVADLEILAAAAALALFALALVVWAVAFVTAVARTTRGDDVVVGNLFFLQGSAPRRVRLQLFGALAVSVVVVALTAWNAPFGVLVPMLPLGLMGLWSARHGRFPPRARRRTDA